MSALVTYEIFSLFVNTSTPDDKFSRRYMQIFRKLFKTPLSKKKRIFLNFLLHFWSVHEI